MNTFKVQKRDMETKAKKLRREGYVTGNLFGKEIEGSVLLKIERKEAERMQRECMKGSQVMLDLDGQSYDVLIKEMDYDPAKNMLMEIDFQALVSNEKVHSVAEIVLVNHDKLEAGVLQQHLEEISFRALPSALVDKVMVDVLLTEVAYKALPKDLVEKVEIDCSELHVGDTLKVSDLAIAKNGNIDITTHLDTPVLNVIVARSAEDDEDAAEEDAAEEAK